MSIVIENIDENQKELFIHQILHEYPTYLIKIDSFKFDAKRTNYSQDNEVIIKNNESLIDVSEILDKHRKQRYDSLTENLTFDDYKKIINYVFNGGGLEKLSINEEIIVTVIENQLNIKK